MRESVASVTVRVDPATAFRAFTEEMNLWWMPGPINYFDATRAVEMRLSPGVGGRLTEVYDATTGEGLVLGEITGWEPGRRLAWRNLLDEAQLEVTFSPAPEGTEVRVTVTLTDGVREQGSLAWTRVVPAWFGPWCNGWGSAPHTRRHLSRLAVGLHYKDPHAAAIWLVDAFQLAPAGPPDGFVNDEGFRWIEFRVGDAALMLFPSDGPVTSSQEVWVYVDDLEGHMAHAQGHGAQIEHGIEENGFRAYAAMDPWGQRWVFAQAGPQNT